MCLDFGPFDKDPLMCFSLTKRPKGGPLIRKTTVHKRAGSPPFARIPVGFIAKVLGPCGCVHAAGKPKGKNNGWGPLKETHPCGCVEAYEQVKSKPPFSHEKVEPTPRPFAHPHPLNA